MDDKKFCIKCGIRVPGRSIDVDLGGNCRECGRKVVDAFTPQKRCPYVFKSPKCGYVGHDTSCDKTSRDCFIYLGKWYQGEQPEKAMPGRKNDSGKLRFELLPPEAVEQIVAVLTKGAEKYNQKISFNDLKEFCTCENLIAIHTGNITLEDFVEVVTKKTSGKEMKNLPKINEQTVTNGYNSIKTERKKQIKNTERIIRNGSGLLDTIGIIHSWPSSPLLKKSSLNAKEGDVLFAEEQDIEQFWTSTIATEQEKSEDFCAETATKPSGYLRMIKNYLKKHTNTCPVRQAIICENGDILLPGTRNWEKGISYGRVYGALQRHLNEFWRGNNIDPEWNLHHLAHAGCCLLFLLTYEMRGMKEWDDRPVKNFE